MVVLKEVKSMFWALFLEAGKRYSQKVERAFHISMAALEIPTDHDSLKAKQSSVVSVMVGMEKGEFLISSLNYKSVYQQPLDLNFYEGEEVTFFLNGDGIVHLTGYELEEEPDMSGMAFDEEDMSEGEESDEEVPQLVSSKGAKRKKANDFVSSKKLKWIEDEADDDDDDDDDDDEADSDEDSPDSDAQDISELLEFEQEDDDDDDDDDDDMDDSDEEDYVPPTKKQSLKQTPKQTPKGDKKGDKQQPQSQQKSGKKEKNKAEAVKSQPQTPANQAGPEGDASESEKKKKKKKKKKKHEQDQETPQPNNQQKQKGQTPVANKDGKGQTPQQKQPQQKGLTPKKQVLAGGTVMEEIRAGEGPAAKSGKMVHVYYVGKLQKDGRQFDSCTKGKPFRFRLGTNEVIKGWDAGLAGMKVGGKRKLVIPPQQAYGSQRQGGIPPNSTLVFEVELKNVS